jgi:putative FmdB family regulatory protein
MPIYEYVCEVCGQRFDKLVRSIQQVPAEVVCPVCQQTQVRRLISAPAKLRTGAGSRTETEGETAPTTGRQVFGRKELNEAMERKRQLKAEIESS